MGNRFSKLAKRAIEKPRRVRTLFPTGNFTVSAFEKDTVRNHEKEYLKRFRKILKIKLKLDLFYEIENNDRKEPSNFSPKGTKTEHELPTTGQKRSFANMRDEIEIRKNQLKNMKPRNKTIYDLSTKEIETIGQVLLARLEIENHESSNEMIVDSGGTAHMFKNEKPFKNIGSKPIGYIKMANDIAIPATSKEDITIDFSNGNLRCKGVLHAPELRKNILSVAKLTDEGYEFLFDEKKVEIHDKITGNIITGIRKENLYYLYPGTLEMY